MMKRRTLFKASEFYWSYNHQVQFITGVGLLSNLLFSVTTDLKCHFISLAHSLALLYRWQSIFWFLNYTGLLLLCLSLFVGWLLFSPTFPKTNKLRKKHVFWMRICWSWYYLARYILVKDQYRRPSWYTESDSTVTFGARLLGDDWGDGDYNPIRALGQQRAMASTITAREASSQRLP